LLLTLVLLIPLLLLVTLLHLVLGRHTKGVVCSGVACSALIYLRGTCSISSYNASINCSYRC
jgi:hypothetical protein